MSDSSRPPNYSTMSSECTNINLDSIVVGSAGESMVSTDAFTITLANDTIDFNNIIMSGHNSMNSTYNIGNNDIITLDELNTVWGSTNEFVDSFPDWDRVQNMCQKYPGLEIALRNFQTIYTLVKDDFDNAKDQE